MKLRFAMITTMGLLLTMAPAFAQTSIRGAQATETTPVTIAIPDDVQAEKTIADRQVIETESVVVTAAGYAQNILDAPASITIITREELETRPFNNLADAVRSIPGISYVGGSGNERDITIRGLPGEYTLILVNGRRQGTRDSRPNGNGGFEASWIPPLSAIERIEVIRGPMSALYGSDAMGGVINIITRKDTQEWRGSVGVDYTMQEHSRSGDTANANAFIGGPLVENLLAMQIYGQGFLREEDDITSGYNESKNRNITGRLIFTPWEDHEFNVEAGISEQKRQSTGGKSVTGSSSTQTTHTREHWAVGYDGDWDYFTAKLNVYQEEGKRNYANSDREPTVNTTITDAMFTIPTMRNLLTVGGQYQYNKLEDSTSNTSNVVIKMKAYQWALFLEDEFFLTEDLILTSGVRMDKHEHFGDHWSPRGYIVWHPLDEITLKGGYSTAFKTPSLKQLDPAYAYPTNGGAAVMYGDPNLKPEESQSWEIGASWHKPNGFLVSATYFDTHFKNKLTNYNTGTMDPLNPSLRLFKYANLGKAVLRGVETSFVFPFEMLSPQLKDFKLTANYTYIFSERQSDEELYSNGTSTRGAALTLTPEHKFDIRLDWQALDALNLYGLVEYRGKQEYAGLRTGYAGPRYSKAFTTLDLGGSYSVTDNVKVSFAVLNVFDNHRLPGEYTGSEWETVEDGRRFWLGTTINF